MATGKSIVADRTPCYPSYGVGKNGRVAKAGNPDGAVSVNQDVCLIHEANVSCVTLVYGRGSTYRLEMSVDDP